jgi:hypothetical protein
MDITIHTYRFNQVHDRRPVAIAAALRGRRMRMLAKAA